MLKYQRILLSAIATLVIIVITFFITNHSIYASAPPTQPATTLANVITNASIKQTNTKKTNFERHFRKSGVNGSILIYDSNNNQFYQYNERRNATPFSPGSTFKILNALVALETGIIQDDVTVLTWDGIDRGFPQWNQDTNLRQAFKDSTIWFYQVLARKAGHQRMQDYINRIGYGNRQIGDKDAIDRFWLDGTLQITPQNQIEFLRRLYKEDLPFSQRTLNLVKDMMILEETPEYKLRGKTGWAGLVYTVNPQIGWIVGYLEQNKNVYFYATNIEIRKPDDARSRLQITRRCFQDIGLL